jgi:hypothetical protein
MHEIRVAPEVLLLLHNCTLYKITALSDRQYVPLTLSESRAVLENESDHPPVHVSENSK